MRVRIVKKMLRLRRIRAKVVRFPTGSSGIKYI